MREKLTKREAEVLGSVTAGLQRKQLAHDLGISFKTFDHHLKIAREKLAVHTTLGAVIKAARAGYITIPGLRKAAFLLLLCSTVQAERLTLSGPINARQGASVTIDVNYGGGAASGLQWDLSGLPVGSSVSIGTAGFGKTLACRPDFTRCLAYGMNGVSVIPAGSIARVHFDMPPRGVVVTASFVRGASTDGSPIILTGSAVTISASKNRRGASR